jgi:hypothetical protein
MRPPERFEAIAILLCATGLIFCAAAPVQAQATRGGGATGGIGGAGGQGSQGGQGGQTGNSAGGILVDAAGVVRPLFHQEAFGRLDKKRRQELAGRLLPADLNHASSMRKISLVQLEIPGRVAAHRLRLCVPR